MPCFYVSSKGFVAECYLSSDREIHIHKYRLDFERRVFIKVSDFCWNVKVKVEILAASTVEESATGQQIPVLLVSQQLKDRSSSSLTCYILFVDLVNDEFVPLRKFNVDFWSSEGNAGFRCVTLLDGPYAAIFMKKDVTIYHNDHSTVLNQSPFNYKNVECSFQECCKDFKSSVKFKALLGIKKIEDMYLLFILVKHHAKCSIHGSDIKCIVKVIQFFEEKFTLLNANHFIPNEYNESLTCIQIKYLKHTGPNTFNSELYLGTSEGFIVHVKNGNLINCNNICENESLISVKMCSDFDGDAASILAVTENILYELTSQLHVKQQYEGVIEVVKGDFFMDGSFQYLMLKQNLSEGKAWIISNMKTTVLSSDDGDGGEQKQTSVSTTTAIKALKARLQSEQILLHEEELQTQRRAGFLSDMFTKQVSIAAGDNSNTDSQQPSMINLIAGKEEGPTHQCETDVRPIGVKGHWQKTYEGIWCVGVDIECYSKRRSTQIWLDVVLNDSCTKTLNTKSSCLMLPAKKTGSHHSKSHMVSSIAGNRGNQDSNMCPVKRKKISDDVDLNLFKELDNNDRDMLGNATGTVVCVLPVPELSCSNSVTANLILNWTHPPEKYEVTSQSDGMEQEGKQKQNKDVHDCRVYTLCCGNLTLTSKDIIGARYELDFNATLEMMEQEVEDFQEMRNNQLAWQHIQTVHSLVVKGNPGTLARFESLLTHTSGFVYNQHYDCYVGTVKTLAAVQIQLEPQTTDDGRLIKVYTRSKKDLFLTIHHLYANLPDNIVILPKENTSTDFLRNCIPALQKEADFLSHGLRKLLNDHEADNVSTDTDDENDEGDVRKVGEKFKRKREKMLRKQSDVLNDIKLSQFIEQYKKIQDVTDLVIATKGNFPVQ